MMNHVMNFVNDEEGATAIEYGLLAALISAVIITIVGAIGVKLNGAFKAVDTGLAAS